MIVLDPDCNAIEPPPRVDPGPFELGPFRIAPVTLLNGEDPEAAVNVRAQFNPNV